MYVQFSISDEPDGTVGVRIAFDPPLTQQTDTTPAGDLACQCLEWIGEHTAQHGGTITARQIPADTH